MSRATRAISIIRQKGEREGLRRAVESARTIASGQLDVRIRNLRNPQQPVLYDVAFINGCDYSVPHPIRYRVTHQMEQLEANGLTTTLIEAANLKLGDVTLARTFIIFRCPCTSLIEEFIAFARLLNKKVLYDIDDLVIDTKYTDTIPFLETLSPEDRELYDDGVNRMGRTMRFCEGVITTTEGMARELDAYMPEVFINRNTASEKMLYRSEKAIYARDVLPSLNKRDVAADELHFWKWARQRHAQRAKRGCTIGYFSGSITHNDDFNMVLPALVHMLDKRPETRLKILGLFDIPSELEQYRDRIDTGGFISWEELPEAIADVDINIAPLVESVFNEAKSENKWVEASLVKVPTIASDIGAFKRMVEGGATGILVENNADDWEHALLDLVDHPEKRTAIGEAAYTFCLRHCTTIRAGKRLADYLRAKQTENIIFHLPTMNISGGVLVMLKHCCLLQDAGYDVGIVDESGWYDKAFFLHDDHVFPVYHINAPKNATRRRLIKARIDIAVATLFTTVNYMLERESIGHALYCVQNYETDFYPYTSADRLIANATYNALGIDYITISKWCQNWLRDDFGKEAAYAPNGIDTKAFYPIERRFDEGKIRILIEGDSAYDYKNVDEAFFITNQLDTNAFEIWYLSYNGEPKDWYRYDRFLHKVPHSKMPDLYRSCHILLKTSLLESFSYPPLEMMATGGFVVAIPNDGNAEYLEDESNCLLFDHNDTEAAVRAIRRIVDDSALRSTLFANGVNCAHDRDWNSIADDIIRLYTLQ